MPNWLYVCLTVLGAGVVCWLLLLAASRRKTFAGDMDVPMNVERERAKSEAEMAAPVSEADAEEAAPLVAFVEEVRSDEYPIVHRVRRRYVRRDIGRRLAVQERHRKAYAAAWSEFLAADPLTAPLPLVHKPAPVLSSVPALEPEWSLGGFTEDWGTTTVADIDRMVAEAKAGAK